MTNLNLVRNFHAECKSFGLYPGRMWQSDGEIEVEEDKA